MIRSESDGAKHCALIRRPLRAMSDNLRARGLRACSVQMRTVVDRDVHCVRHKEEGLLQRCEKALDDDCLPNRLKAKVMPRHSSLIEQAAPKVEKLAGRCTRPHLSGSGAVQLDTDADDKQQKHQRPFSRMEIQMK